MTPTTGRQAEPALSEGRQTETAQVGVKSTRKSKKSGKLPPGVAHVVSRAIRDNHGSRSPIGTRVVMAIDFADHGGLVRAIEKTVAGLEGPYVELWGKSGVADGAGMYTFIDETKTKNAPGGKPGCEPDLLVVSGHGVQGHLADSEEIGRWRLSEVAAAIVQRLPCVQVIVFALCNTNADKAIARELSGITRGGRKSPTVPGGEHGGGLPPRVRRAVSDLALAVRCLTWGQASESVSSECVRVERAGACRASESASEKQEHDALL